MKEYDVMGDEQCSQTPAWELRESRRHCWYDECERTAILNWCGWRYCLRHYYSQVFRDAEGFAHKLVKLRFTHIIWEHLNPAAAWRRRQRKVDIAILWLAIRSATPTLDKARVTFFFHCQSDPAWSDCTKEEIASLIDHLE